MFETVADTVADLEAETLGDTLCDVEAKGFDVMVADTMKDTKTKSLRNTLVMGLKL